MKSVFGEEIVRFVDRLNALHTTQPLIQLQLMEYAFTTQLRGQALLRVYNLPVSPEEVAAAEYHPTAGELGVDFMMAWEPVMRAQTRTGPALPRKICSP